jgi:2-dehydro-3-deoxyphosphogluconate aldolase/(4S)-4-hydroxy-2-oxoglutarate aldolase
MIPREMVSLIARRKLVAEVRVDTATQALSVVDALAAGGVGAFEIALTIPGASEILTHYAMRGDIIVGAGAVLEAQQALDAISSGARFIASPICAPDVAQTCQEKGVACVLGALTPTEIITAQRAGAEMVKLFPVEAIGGPAYLRALLRQLTHISVQISGGFSIEHLIEYASLPIRSIALGALLAPPELVERAAWQALTNRAQAFVQFASNPHAFAAQFLALMSPPRPQAPQIPPAQRVVANLPTVPVSPGAIPAPPAARLDEAPALIRPPAAWQESAVGSGDGSGGGGSGRINPAASAPPPGVALGPTATSGPAPNIPGTGSRNNPASNVPPPGQRGAPEPFQPWDSTPLQQGDDEDWLR